MSETVDFGSYRDKRNGLSAPARVLGKIGRLADAALCTFGMDMFNDGDEEEASYPTPLQERRLGAAVVGVAVSGIMTIGIAAGISNYQDERYEQIMDGVDKCAADVMRDNPTINTLEDGRRYCIQTSFETPDTYGS